MVIDVSKSRAVLTTHNIAKALRSKEAVGVVDIKSWPTVVEVDDAPKKKLTNPYRAPTPEMIAYLDFSVSTTGMLSGVKVSLTKYLKPQWRGSPIKVSGVILRNFERIF